MPGNGVAHMVVSERSGGPGSVQLGFTRLQFPAFHSCYRTPGPQKGSEGFLQGPRTCQLKVPSKPLQNAFKNPSKTFQGGAEINDASGFPGLKNQFQDPGVLQQEMKVLRLRFQVHSVAYWRHIARCCGTIAAMCPISRDTFSGTG